MTTPQMGEIGIWSAELRFDDEKAITAAAAELEELGYGTLWVPGGIDTEVLKSVDHLLSATKHITIATGILNLWMHEAKDVAGWFKALSESHRERVMLGIGVSHGPIVGEAWVRPLAKMQVYLDNLEAAGMALDQCCIGALGPKMLALSGERTAGAHPYLVFPEHTTMAREILGPEKLLMPEQGVILETDPARARKIGLAALEPYRSLPNYLNNWKRLGFSDEEIATISDRLFDKIFAWGDVGQVAKRVNEHLSAGADHVCLQLLAGEGSGISQLLPKWRELASALALKFHSSLSHDL